MPTTRTNDAAVPLPDLSARRMIRQRAKLSLRGIAAAVGCSIGSVSQWERGAEPREKWRDRYASELQRIAEISELVGL
jgi:transcriptional regulator with XRE-family HTH domain